MSNKALERTHAWSDGSAVVYTNWNPGEPNTPSWDHVYMSSNDRWYDQPSGSNFRGVIETAALPGDPALAGAGLDAQYILSVEVTDLVPPAVLGVGRLPVEGGTTGLVLGSFSVSFSEALDQSTLVGGAFDLREAGVDGSFNTSDDVVYTLNQNYNTNNLHLNFTITNKPINNNIYHLTITDNITNKISNTLNNKNNKITNNIFMHNFTINTIPKNTIFKNHNNNNYLNTTKLKLTTNNNKTK